MALAAVAILVVCLVLRRRKASGAASKQQQALGAYDPAYAGADLPLKVGAMPRTQVAREMRCSICLSSWPRRRTPHRAGRWCVQGPESNFTVHAQAN